MTHIRLLFTELKNTENKLSYASARVWADLLEPLPAHNKAEFELQKMKNAMELRYPNERQNDGNEKQVAEIFSEEDKVWGRLGSALADIADTNLPVKYEGFIERSGLESDEADEALDRPQYIFENKKIAAPITKQFAENEQMASGMMFAKPKTSGNADAYSFMN